MPVIECHHCGENENLTGRDVGGDIEITCNRCGHAWKRDAEPSCPTCGSLDVVPFKEPMIQRARGNAYSIVGEQTIHLCRTCDADEISRRTPRPTERPHREDPWK